MNPMIDRRLASAALIILGMSALVAVGLSLSQPDHDAVLSAAMMDLAAREVVTGTIRIETLVPSGVLGLGLQDAPNIRLPIGVAGSFRFDLGSEGRPPVFAAELLLALEGGETLPDAPGMDILTTGHGTVYLRPHDFPTAEEFGIDMAQLDGRWFRVATREFAALTGGDVLAANEVPTRDPDLSGMKSMLADGVFTVVRRIAAEDIGGLPTRHYRVAPSSAPFLLFLEDAIEQFLGRDRTDAEQEALLRSAAGAGIVAEAWVDAETPTLRRFGFDVVAIDGSDAAPVRVIIDITPSESPVVDMVPVDAESFLEAILTELGWEVDAA